MGRRFFLGDPQGVVGQLMCLSDSPQRSAESLMVGVVQANETEAQLGVSALSTAIQEFNQCPNVAGRSWNFNFSQRATPKVLSEESATAGHGQVQ